MVARRRAVGRKPKVQGSVRGPRRVASEDAIAQQADIRADAENDLDRNVHAYRDQDIPSDDPVHGAAEDWAPPSLLPHVPPRPGFTQRWIRVASRGQDDVRNYMARFREGWQPRRPETVRGFAVPTLNHGSLGSCIMVEGMVLCEMPESRNAQRAAYYQKRLDQQTRAIDEQLLKIQQPGHPIDRQAKTRVTVGRRPQVLQDEDEAA